jgi:hypothetical protein
MTFGLRMKFSVSLAFIGWTYYSLDQELCSPFISPSLAGWMTFGLRIKFSISLAFIGWTYDSLD